VVAAWRWDDRETLLKGVQLRVKRRSGAGTGNRQDTRPGLRSLSDSAVEVT